MKSSVVKESRFNHCCQVAMTIFSTMKCKRDVVRCIPSLGVISANGVNDANVVNDDNGV